MKKGEYKQWYKSNGSHLTLFRDSKFVNIFDTFVDQNKLVKIRRRRKKKEKKKSKCRIKEYIVPYGIGLYNGIMGSVDASNSRAKIHMIGNKHRRKHNRCYLGLFHRIALQNAALLYGAYLGLKEVDQKPWLEELCKALAKDFEIASGVTKQVAKKKTGGAIEDAVIKRGYGHNHIHKLVKNRTRIKCYVHKKISTWYKCDTCTVFNQPVGFCHPNHCRGPSRNCFAEYGLHVGHHQIADD